MASTTAPTITLAQKAPAALADITEDALIIPIFEEDGCGKAPAPLWRSATTNALDTLLSGLVGEECAYVDHLVWRLGDAHVIRLPENAPVRYAVLTGMGSGKGGNNTGVTPTQIRRSFATGFKAAQQFGIKTLASIIDPLDILLDGGTPVTLKQLACWQAEAAQLSTYQFTKHKTDTSKLPTHLNTIILYPPLQATDEQHKAVTQGVIQGQAEANSTCLARDWVFDSANHITPTYLKEQAETLSKHDITVNHLTLDEIKAKGMGAFYSVAKGSDEPAYLVHMQYKPKQGSAHKKVSLVGKGVTFDSGGLSLKPSKSMELMKLDMAGAAAVLATMHGLAELRNHGVEVPLQVDGFIALCENMPNGHASKPGDIVTTLDGKTVEINNTDAEGRLILIDTLTYAQQQVDPDEMIDLATLTGAAITALGHACAAVISPQKDFADEVINAGYAAGEQFWQLPLLADYNESLKSDVADLINAGSRGQAGTASAGLFLKQFVDKKRRWAHLDIAGPAYTTKAEPEAPKGATGFGVRTLLHYLLSHTKP